MALNACYGSMDLCAVRTAQLTSGGAPVSGTGNGYVSDAMTKLDIAMDIQKGAEFTTVNGCGTVVATFKEPDIVKRLTFTLEVGLFDMPLLQHLTGASLFTHAATDAATGNVVGWQMPALAATAQQHVSMEAWSKAVIGDTLGTPPVLGGAAAFIHWVFPNTDWTYGNITLNNGMATFPVTGEGVENPNITPDGPFNDWPQDIINGGGVTRIGGAFFDANIPTAVCDNIDVPVQ